jgi:ATP-dependent protease ClpP protease subunit
MRRSLSARFRSLFVSVVIAAMGMAASAAAVLADSGGPPFPK